MPGTQTALLDNIRISNGSDFLRSYFHELLHTDRENLLALLNDQNLRFCSLYVLKQDILTNQLQENLPSLLKKALEISDELSGKTNTRSTKSRLDKTRSRPDPSLQARLNAAVEERMRMDKQTVSPPLEWIVETGWSDPLPDAAYEILLERCTSLLLKSLTNRSLLSVVAWHIFDRNRRDKLIHNLVWAFFEAKDTDSLYLLAKRLNSEDIRDTALAKKLLGFIPGLEATDGVSAYYRAMQWLSENQPFLCYTGESMKMCSKPIYYTVSMEAKYLCRQVSANNGRPLSQLHDKELKLLMEFRRLPEAEQLLLSNFSYMLQKRDIHQWNSWIGLPVARQSEAASVVMGGLS